MWDVNKDITEFIEQDLTKELVAVGKYVESFYNPNINVSMEDFPSDTQELLKHIVESEGPGLVDKTDLAKYGKVDGWMDMLFSPIGQISNTLGQFTVGDTPQFNKEKVKGTKYITDKYDWSGKDYSTMSYLGHGFRNTLGKLSYEYGATNTNSNKPFYFEVK